MEEIAIERKKEWQNTVIQKLKCDKQSISITINININKQT